nr:MAG TPA: hypothetical protein [Caudoviricetes sp.]
MLQLAYPQVLNQLVGTAETWSVFEVHTNKKIMLLAFQSYLQLNHRPQS